MLVGPPQSCDHFGCPHEVLLNSFTCPTLWRHARQVSQVVQLVCKLDQLGLVGYMWGVLDLKTLAFLLGETFVICDLHHYVWGNGMGKYKKNNLIASYPIHFSTLVFLCVCACVCVCCSDQSCAKSFSFLFPLLCVRARVYMHACKHLVWFQFYPLFQL